MTWVVRQGCKGGMYLWGWSKGFDDYYSSGLARRDSAPSPEWGCQGGATRYTNRVTAVRDARRANGRIVKLVPRDTSGTGEGSK